MVRISLRCLCTSVRVRFAPSPTGLMHLGGARTALYNHLLARKHNGTFILRIEDTDRDRLQPGAVRSIMQDLEWLGITVGDGPYEQSQRVHVYKQYADELLSSGAAYHCFCSNDRLSLLRRDALRQRQTPKYDNKCRFLSHDEAHERLKAGHKHVVRFRLRPAPNSIHDTVFGDVIQQIDEIEGDPVIIKSDSYPTYHFANVIDDHLMHITHVIRGEEWLNSTVKHHQMYAAFNWTPPTFVHLPVMTDGKGRKLSKRHGDVSISSYRQQGYLPLAVVNFLTRNGLGLRDRDPKRIYTMAELIEMFDMSNMKRIATAVDFDWLDYYGAQVITSLSRTDLVSLVRSMVLKQCTSLSEAESSRMSHPAFINQAIDFTAHTTRNVSKMSDFVDGELSGLWSGPKNVKSLMPLLAKIKQQNDQLSIDRLSADLRETLSSSDDVSKHLAEFSSRHGLKRSAVMQLVRFCLIGRFSGAPVHDLVTLLGADIVSDRIRRVQELLKKL